MAAFPERIGGNVLEITAFTGDEVIAGAEADDPVNELVDVVAAQGASMSDFAIASAAVRDRDPFIGLLAASITGVPAADVVPDLTRLILETDEDVVQSQELVAGREVTRVGPGSGLTGDDAVYVLTSDEIAWYIVADRADLEEVLSVLP